LLISQPSVQVALASLQQILGPCILPQYRDEGGKNKGHWKCWTLVAVLPHDGLTNDLRASNFNFPWE